MKSSNLLQIFPKALEKNDFDEKTYEKIKKSIVRVNRKISCRMCGFCCPGSVKPIPLKEALILAKKKPSVVDLSRFVYYHDSHTFGFESNFDFTCRFLSNHEGMYEDTYQYIKEIFTECNKQTGKDWYQVSTEVFKDIVNSVKEQFSFKKRSCLLYPDGLIYCLLGGFHNNLCPLNVDFTRNLDTDDWEIIKETEKYLLFLQDIIKQESLNYRSNYFGTIYYFEKRKKHIFLDIQNDRLEMSYYLAKNIVNKKLSLTQLRSEKFNAPLKEFRRNMEFLIYDFRNDFRYMVAAYQLHAMWMIALTEGKRITDKWIDEILSLTERMKAFSNL